MLSFARSGVASAALATIVGLGVATSVAAQSAPSTEPGAAPPDTAVPPAVSPPPQSEAAPPQVAVPPPSNVAPQPQAAPEPAPPLPTPYYARQRLEPLRVLGPAREAPHWFRGELAAAYLAPPVALAIFALTAGKDAILVPALIGVAGVAMPPLVHSLNGDSSGALYALLGMTAASGAGAFSGVAIGHLAPGDTTEKRAAQHDAAVFGLLGYSMWALIDVMFFAVAAPPSSGLVASLVPRTGPASARGLIPNGLELRASAAF